MKEGGCSFLTDGPEEADFRPTPRSWLDSAADSRLRRASINGFFTPAANHGGLGGLSPLWKFSARKSTGGESGESVALAF